MCGVAGGSGSDELAEKAVSRRWYPAFRYPNYRLFFIASIVSLNGTWIQLVAEGWLVYEITGSTRDLGITRFLHTIPVTFITLFAGILADKVDKRKQRKEMKSKEGLPEPCWFATIAIPRCVDVATTRPGLKFSRMPKRRGWREWTLAQHQSGATRL